jgi:hypothetical protein
MSFLDRLRIKNGPLPLDGSDGPLGDASPSHYLADNPEADSPSDPWRYGFTRRRFIQGGGQVYTTWPGLDNDDDATSPA